MTADTEKRRCAGCGMKVEGPQGWHPDSAHVARWRRKAKTTLDDAIDELDALESTLTELRRERDDFASCLALIAMDCAGCEDDDCAACCAREGLEHHGVTVQRALAQGDAHAAALAAQASTPPAQAPGEREEA